MTPKDYVLPLARRWWLIVAAVVIAIASSYFATRQQPPIYRARVTLMVGRSLEVLNPSSNDLYLTQALASTYADLAQRERVRERTMTALGLSWLPNYTVGIVPNTQLLDLTVEDNVPERAQAVANELARQLALMSPTSPDQEGQPRQAFINQQLDDLEASIKQTKDELVKKQAELKGLFSARQIADTQAQIGALQNKLSTLQSNYASLLQSTQQGATNTITIMEKASLPIMPVGPNKMATIMMAAAIALVLSVAAAYLLEYLDDTIKTSDDVQKNLGLPTLARVPFMKEVERHSGNGILSTPLGAEAYGMLRASLQFAAVGHNLSALLVTSPQPCEGKSLTVANVGTVLAQAGQRVILVDADLRRPQLHRLFGLTNNVGVTSLLLQPRPDLGATLQATGVPNLSLLAAGPLPPNPSALLSSEPMRELLAHLRTQADMVIVDTPPAVVFSDAAILSALLDGVLLVISAGHSKRESAVRVVEQLNQVKASVIGVVLNRIPARSHEYYYHYHYYGNQRRSFFGRRRNDRPESLPPAPATPNPKSSTEAVS